MLGCHQTQEKALRVNEYGLSNCPSYCTPQVYAIHRLLEAPCIDGLILDDEWGEAPWSDPLVPSVKNGMDYPSNGASYKLGIKGDSLYLCAIVHDRHIWAVNDICQSYFFEDNFLEFYLDADKDEADYVVLKINALGNFCGEYRNRNNTEPILRFSLLDKPHGRCSVSVEGTLNNPLDNDEYWSFECVVPLFLQVDSVNLLQAHHSWNVNVQRTHWPFVVVSGLYKKMLNPHTGKKYPGEKWVWSFLDESSIYNPELWGVWYFNDHNLSEGEKKQQQYVEEVRWELRNIYYAQQAYLKRYGRFSKKVVGLKDVGLKVSQLRYDLHMKVQDSTFEIDIVNAEIEARYVINQEGKIWQEKLL